ncbi:pilus assembly protein TadG-related protein [Yinghuangia soli]|uniref:Putative Flp pilus-assembly TadG-like N-terminal domain-containing protein n=1 Tax=Yinghuangia soli TaxID=2908204 RepID=A0AA41U2X2_9ACTN|nr:pilus assembly protein TadG-related protein [Yinghuangia soli]MCF2531165.1 hypothetical protein [Yinghuangia soli]
MGQVTAFVVALVSTLILCAGLVLDGGLALAAKVDAMDAAQEAARAGTQPVDPRGLRGSAPFALEPAKARQAAIASLTAAGYQGTVNVVGLRVTVRVTHEQRTQLLSLAGIRTIQVTAVATAEAQRGVTTSTQGGG